MIYVWTLQEAWSEACRRCVRDGYVYTIQHGSYEGQQRKQLPFLALHIQHPEMRPLAPLTQGVPVATDESIDEYFVSYLIIQKRQKGKIILMVSV